MRRLNIKTVLGSFIVILMSAARVGLAQGGNDTARGDDVFFVDGASQEPDSPLPTQETIKIHNITTGKDREVFRPKFGRLFDFRVSPTSAMIAVTEQVRKFNVALELATTVINGYTVSERTILRIVDWNGKDIDQIEGGVRGFAWSQDGRQLAYVTGDYKDSDGPYQNTKAWIWDSTDKSRLQISDRDLFKEISWAAFDDNIYLWERDKAGTYGTVLRYNVVARRLETTTHRGIYFSPTGTYYFHGGGGHRENVYLRATDTVLKSQTLSGLAAWDPGPWARDRDFLLIGSMRGPNEPHELAVFDPASDSLSFLTLGESFVWGQDSTEVVAKVGDRYEKRRIR
jgi:hypothetical protein